MGAHNESLLSVYIPIASAPLDNIRFLVCIERTA